MQNITIEEAQNWYREADPVHDFYHVLRVVAIAEKLAIIEGACLKIIRAAALLHDSRGSAPGAEGGQRGQHHIASADFAGEVLTARGWPAAYIFAVQHCVRTHRYRGGANKPETLEAKVIFDADKLDVLGAIGAARTIAYAALDGMPVYAEPSQQFIQTGEKVAGEPHSSYHEYLFKLSRVKDRMFTQSGRVLAEGRHAFLVAFYNQLQNEIRGAC